MKNFPSKPKHSAIASAVQQALLIPAGTNIQPNCSTASKPQPERSSVPNPVKIPDFDTLPDSGFVRLPSLLLLFACSRATIWRWVKAQKIPAPKKLGPRVTAWNVGELRQTLSACMEREAA